MAPSTDPNRQRNIYLMIGAVAVVVIWLLWTAISPGGSSTPTAAPQTTSTIVTTPTAGTTGTIDTVGTTGTTDTTGGFDTIGTTGTTDSNLVIGPDSTSTTGTTP
jgi:hypothetical protein